MNYDSDWAETVHARAQEFTAQFGASYFLKSRELAAAFEVGCFHLLIDFYGRTVTYTPENLWDGAFRYLTSPTGNPDNFSFVRLSSGFEIRQQVRIRSTLDGRIAFTPDIVVIRPDSPIGRDSHEDYARGRQGFFFVLSSEVAAAHECKSMTPFPELLVSFFGMFALSHSWFDPANPLERLSPSGEHLAPTLFVGGPATAWQRHMVDALQAQFPINIITNVHGNRFDPEASDAQLIRLTG